MNEGNSSPNSFGSEPITFDTDLDLTSSFIVDNIVSTDTDLFKYFLNEDIVEHNDIFATSSPNSYSEHTNDSGSSPQPSPPQLSPELTDLSTTISNSQITNQQAFDFTNSQSNPSVAITIKQEGSVNPRMISGSTPTAISNGKSETKAKNSRKRERSKEVEITVPSTGAPLALSKDDLLKLSSKGMDSLTQALSSTRQLTPDEEKQLKRQKRLIKNRESAQLSRLRKKIYIEELEKKVSQLTTETENFSKQVATLQSENKKLRDEVLYLQNLVKQSPDLSATIAKRSSSLPAKNMKTAGVCLLVVLFSIGLLFNVKENPNKFSRTREEIPEVVPKSKGMFSGRVLKSIEDDNLPPVSNTPSKTVEFTEEKPQLDVVVSKKHARNYDYDSDNDDVIVRHEKPTSSSSADKRKRVKISEENDSSKLSLAPSTGISEKAAIKAADNQVVIRRDPAASYIYCPDAHHLPPATISSSSGPEMIALLVPASILNGTLINGNPVLDSSLLEISCSVLNLHMWPMQNATTSN